jgi:hypothetical protein
MRFSTFFTSTCSSGRAAIVLMVLLLSGAHAQDRTTEAGEAQIKGTSQFTPFANLSISLSFISLSFFRSKYRVHPLQLPAGIQPDHIVPSNMANRLNLAERYTRPKQMGWDSNERSKYCSQGRNIFLQWHMFRAHLSVDAQGTPTGNFTSVNYPPTDPDCWWTYHQCITPKLPGLANDIANVPEVRDALLF